jgi:DNA-binding CsgD family transcriptional regulator
VLAKLGVTNRAQAVSAAHRLDLTRGPASGS